MTARHFFCRSAASIRFIASASRPTFSASMSYCLEDFDPAGIPVRPHRWRYNEMSGGARELHFRPGRIDLAVVRYLVADVDAAIAFYIGTLGFELVEKWGPPFAMVKRGDLTLWLSAPGSSAARPLADGSRPVPGGWNRLVLESNDLAALVEKVERSGARFAARSLPGRAENRFWSTTRREIPSSCSNRARSEHEQIRLRSTTSSLRSITFFTATGSNRSCARAPRWRHCSAIAGSTPTQPCTTRPAASAPRRSDSCNTATACAASDLSPGAIERLRDRACAPRALRADARVDDLRTLEHVASAFGGGRHRLRQLDSALAVRRRDPVARSNPVYRCLRPGGIAVFSVRDYAAIERRNPDVRPYGMHRDNGRRLLAVQVWEWDGDQYDLRLYLTSESAAGACETRVLKSRYYAVSIAKLLELMAAAGFVGRRSVAMTSSSSRSSSGRRAHGR